MLFRNSPLSATGLCWMRSALLVVTTIVLAGLSSGTALAEALPAKISYNEHIQPILAENCFHCHGPDSATRKGKLRLDRSDDALLPRGDHDAAILAGKPDESMLIERILSPYEDERMPPLESHKTLKPREVALLKQWITEGAVYEKHWSFLAPQRPPVPSVTWGDKPANHPVDAFVAEKLNQEMLAPAAREEPTRLLRRLVFDLTGLPPTPEQIAQFTADSSPAAYESLVDRLLASDAASEQFARHWLDAVRYADTHGIHIDNYRSIWPYRDWVIDAFRRNQPFDQFTIEQVAGDMLTNATLDQKIASGFNRCLPTTSEGGAIAEEYEAIYAKDRVETLSTVWLGLTTGCAACHDHKFDPVTQKDFYSLTAFFRNNTMQAMDGNRADPPPTLFIPAMQDREGWPKLERAIADVRRQAQNRLKSGEADYQRWLGETNSSGKGKADTSLANSKLPGGSSRRLIPAPVDHRVSLHWPLNEGRFDQKGEGSLRSLVEPVDGLYGPAPSLNGLDLEVGPSVRWTNDHAEGFVFLIRVSGAPSGALLTTLVGEGEGAGWELFFESGKLGFSLADGTEALAVRELMSEPLSADRWHHVMVSFDTSSPRSRVVEVYVDGKSSLNSGNAARLPVDIVPRGPVRLGSRQPLIGKASSAALTGGSVWIQDFRRSDRSLNTGDARAAAAVLELPTLLALPADQRTLVQEKVLRSYYFDAVDPTARSLAASLVPLLREEDAYRSRGVLTLVMEEKMDTEPVAHILNRGEYSQPTEKVPAATPEMLPPLPDGQRADRLALARWLVSADNPLTARVTVNRLWQSLFGVGLVDSTGDFGVMGSRPSHPHLLDWLAVEFRESGWDYRHMARLIVTSKTYQQSAQVKPALLERDPENRLLARGPRARLDAEQLRDQALAASGLLVNRLHGRPVKPYQPQGIWEEVAMKESSTRFYRQDVGEDLYRRSIYTLWKRTAAPPAMEILNAPSREVSCVRRDRTNTPLQALVTLNEPIFVESSRQLASQALTSAKTFDARLDVISMRLLARAFAPAEREIVHRTLDRALATYQATPRLAQQLLGVGDYPVNASLAAPELAAWTLVASQVMNLDESLTK